MYYIGTYYLYFRNLLKNKCIQILLFMYQCKVYIVFRIICEVINNYYL